MAEDPGFMPTPDDVSRLRDETTELSKLFTDLMADADRASRTIEQGLLRAVRSGKFGFEDLGKIALSVMAQIAQAAVRNGLNEILGGGGGSGQGGLLNLGASLLTSALGLPGRATGGPVAPGRAYLVGERGPEMFLPTSSGQVLPATGRGASRDVRIAITVNGTGGDAPRALARSARQVARAVRGALAE